MTPPDPGWPWSEAPAGPGGGAARPSVDEELARACARCFRGPDGERVLAHLRGLTLDRALGPGTPDAVLRHVEGQRQLVAHLAALIERGRSGGPDIANRGDDR